MRERFLAVSNPGRTVNLASEGRSMLGAVIPRAVSNMHCADICSESNVVETETGSLCKRNMFREELLAVRLGQAKTRHAVMVSVRVSRFVLQARSRLVLRFFQSAGDVARRAELPGGPAGNSNFFGDARLTELSGSPRG
jgi:hypothetical protein